jgi:hypothetical protein
MATIVGWIVIIGLALIGLNALIEKYGKNGK